MKRTDDLLNPSAEWLQIDNPFKLVEYVSKLCHKSENTITEDSCYPFVGSLIQNEHYAMLEHAVFHFLIVPHSDMNIPEMLINIPKVFAHRCAQGWIVTVSMSHIFDPTWNNILFDSFRDGIVSQYELWNYDAFNVEKPEENLSYPMLLHTSNGCFAEIYMVTDEYVYSTLSNFSRYHISKSCKFVCDRGVSHELVRHRASFSQESTRYCNYNTDKFDHSISYILPSTWNSWDEMCKGQFIDHISASESIYNYLSYRHLPPEQARTILPNALKTELVMTANLNQWDHFFDLRYFGKTGDPHPDMKLVAGLAYQNYLWK